MQIPFSTIRLKHFVELKGAIRLSESIVEDYNGYCFTGAEQKRTNKTVKGPRV